MAKVMISLPDELLGRLDQRAHKLGETRSGLLRRLVERELGARSPSDQRRIEQLLSLAAPQDGRSTEAVRKARASR